MQQQAISLQSQYNYNTKQVVYLCQMTEQELNHFIMEMADTWIHRFFHHLPNVEQILSSAVYWKWFKMHWLDRDDRYFLKHLYNISSDLRFIKYRQMHQCIFDNKNDFMYNDFLDIYKIFSHETKV